ncbi:tripartite tricarboxylate transporter permease [Paraburkholderia antibiotica]|uniref:Tripartite tricarboxylate transporter permease n=1 Tax=Paraburkholderia antibiotica TaxID=2728839 RepID=A0A7X9X7I9_9BURK|nr:tripartite tricarboxylate transporter permease [Paraburkholderia antibiotica]NML32885.1 tripartite tricarboxylate transporter permease [Paraburkholderia antibiotica]
MESLAIHNLIYGFSVALQPNNLAWSFFGVIIGNLIGVLPGMGALSAISILMPLTYVLNPVAGILMLAGIFYGSQYGGAIGAILLNLPSHPPHAVTCLDGYPMTRAGKGATALGITMFCSFFAASVGIVVMILASPLLTRVALDFGPTELFSIMLFGLLAGAMMARGSALKGVGMTLFGILCGIIGTDPNTGVYRFTFGLTNLNDGLELVAVAMGLFGVADFLLNVNRIQPIVHNTKIRLRDMRPSRSEMKQAFWPMVRGTTIGTLFGAMPGTGPTITTFLAYAFERKISKNPDSFGTGNIAGVAAPEASAHAKTQVDFIPTMSLGIPGDAVMALILGALLIQGISPGPQLISDHPDIFWGLIASFWIGNVLLIVLNVPLIGVWVKLLRIPYRLMFPCAMFFICVGVFSTQNNLFQIWEVLAFGVIGALAMGLGFPVAPILLGFVLGPMIEENFRRALLLSRGDMNIFLQRPISAVFVGLCALLLLGTAYSSLRTRRNARSRLSGPVNQ